MPGGRRRSTWPTVSRAIVAEPGSFLKREDLCHTGAHKINNVLGQALLAARMGKPRIVAETGAGQHGVASATAAALLGLTLRRLHGQRGRGPPGAQRVPHEAARRHRDPRGERLQNAEGRRERGAPRLGHQRPHDVLPPRIRDGASPVPHDGSRLPPRDRRGGSRSDETGHRAAARPRGGVRRRRLQCDRPLLAVHRGFACSHRGRGGRRARRGDGQAWRLARWRRRRRAPRAA